jgi:hypothetical protein
MGKTYGIQIAKEVLSKLSSSEEMGARLNRAILELGVIVYENNKNQDDVSKDEFDDIQDLKTRYNEITNSKIVDRRKLEFKSEELSELCCKIIQENTISQNSKL